VTNDGNHDSDVFVRDLATGNVELISAVQSALFSQTPSAPISGPVFSASSDARFVAFTSETDDLIPGSSNVYRGVFVHDFLTGTNALVSVDTNGLANANGQSTDPSISGDGRYVAFASAASNVTPLATNLIPNIFLRDLQAGTTTLITVNSNGTDSGNAASSLPVLSSNAQFVLFRNQAANLVPGTSSALNLYCRNLQN